MFADKETMTEEFTGNKKVRNPKMFLCIVP